MIGIWGKPFEDSFAVRWSESAKQLKAQGAGEVITDAEAKRRGYVVQAAKAHALSQRKSK